MRHPLVPPVAATLAGAVAGGLMGGVWPVAAAVSVLACVGAWVALARGASRTLLLCVCVGCAAAGAGSAALADRQAARPSLAQVLDLAPGMIGGDEPLSIEGVLRRDAEIDRDVTRLDLLVETVRLNGVVRRVEGGVRLSVRGGYGPAVAGQWRAGRRLRLSASLRRATAYRNPGGVGALAERDLARRGAVYLGTVKSAALVEILSRGSPGAELAAGVRAFVRRAVAERVGTTSVPAAGVVTAILIGDRSGLADEDERRLQEAGTYHVIAISGGNIAILTGLLLGLLRLARVPPRPAAAVVIGLLVAYASLVGDEPSVERATVAAAAYFAARLLDHRTPALNALALAAGVILARDPLAFADGGFVLSFGATLAILLGVPPAIERLRGALHGRPVTLVRIISVAAGLFVATPCAEAALAPVSAALFSRVSFAGLVLNFLAIPLMTVAQVSGLAVVGLHGINGWAGDAAGVVAGTAAAGLLASAEPVEWAPWLSRRVPAPPGWLLAAYYGAWAVWFVGRRRPRLRLAAVPGILSSALLMLAGPLPSVADARRDWLRVTVLDVGQGDATLVWFPDGRALLVDAGGSLGARYDVGARIVAPALWRLGVRRLHAVAVTHADPDHIGGARAALRDFRPQAVWEGVPVPRDVALALLRDEADGRGVEWRRIQAGDRVWIGGVEVAALHPPPPDWERQQVRNDDSLVLELRHGDVSIVLPGDIGRDVEPAVASRLAPARVRILKVAHHGSASSTSAAFLAAARPAAAIVSTGRGNPFGHPHPNVLARLRAAGAEIFRTDEDGAVTVETDGSTVEIRTWTGRVVTVAGQNHEAHEGHEGHDGQGLIERLDTVVHVAQVLSYLRATGLRAGLLLNFRVAHLRQGIRRVVL